MIIGIGTDIADVRRIVEVQERHGDHFLRTFLTDREKHLADERQKNASEFLAGRWAGKEAVSKALGTGIGRDCALTEIEILPDPEGVPVAEQTGAALATAQRKGVRKIHLSLSHERDYAVAFAVQES